MGIKIFTKTANEVSQTRFRKLKWLTIPICFAFSLGLPKSGEAGYASLVMDYKTGAILKEEAADVRNHPASLTKIMTLYLTFDALAKNKITLEQRMPVSAYAAGMSPTKLSLAPGSSLRVEDAILGLVTRSANDAAVVLAEIIGGSEVGFSRLMTQRARQLGMRSTVFVNASGLPSARQVSTARDMAVLARAIIRDFPQYYHYFNTRRFVFKGSGIDNHNRLLGVYPGADGIKTGYVNASGYNLVASAVQSGRRIIGVVFGGSTAAARDKRMIRLLDYGFQMAKDNENEENDKSILTEVTKLTPQSATELYSKLPLLGQGDKATEKKNIQLTSLSRQTGTKSSSQVYARRWRIQIGNFINRHEAESAARSAVSVIPNLLHHSKPKIVKVQKRRFRAEIAELTQKQAILSCKTLQMSNRVCLVQGE